MGEIGSHVGIRIQHTTGNETVVTVRRTGPASQQHGQGSDSSSLGLQVGNRWELRRKEFTLRCS